MTGNRGLFVRFHARLRDERGFSLVEAIIAITVIFGALTVLAYSASSGFGYQALSRERQGATAIADKLMEQARGLAYAKIQAGLKASDLASDVTQGFVVKDCPGDPAIPTTYRLKPESGDPCSGDRIVASSSDSDTPPLVPHEGSFGAPEGYPTTYQTRVYVTNNNPANEPYRVVVVVGWGVGAVNGVARSITTESLFYSPTGCVSNQTHPYAAPCQPFFYGQAQIPRGAVTITGTIGGFSPVEAHLYTAGAEANAQQEQFSAAQSALSQSGAALDDSLEITETVGGSAQTTAASDTDPSGTIPPYGDALLIPVPGGTLSSDPGQSPVTVTAPSGDSGAAQAATAAGAGQLCPPWGLENDAAICSGTQIQQGSAEPGGTLSATADLSNVYGVNLGTASLATIAAPSDPSKALVDRVLATGVDGQLASTVWRSFGPVTLGGSPTTLTSPLYPAGWVPGSYLVTMNGYRDTATASSGTGAPVPSGAVDPGATVTFWNGTTFVTQSASLAVQPGPLTIIDNVDGRQVLIEITSTEFAPATLAPTSTECADLAGSLCDADAQMTGPLSGTISYKVTLDPFTTPVIAVDLSVQVELGTMIARSLYQPAPQAG